MGDDDIYLVRGCASFPKTFSCSFSGGEKGRGLLCLQWEKKEGTKEPWLVLVYFFSNFHFLPWSAGWSLSKRSFSHWENPEWESLLQTESRERNRGKSWKGKCSIKALWFVCVCLHVCLLRSRATERQRSRTCSLLLGIPLLLISWALLVVTEASLKSHDDGLVSQFYSWGT